MDESIFCPRGLAQPRPNFGEKVVADLSKELNVYIKKYGHDMTSVWCWNTLYGYHEFHSRSGIRNAELYACFEIIPTPNSNTLDGDFMVRPQTSEAILQRSAMDFESFAFSRVSVRNFAPEAVELDLIKQAARTAQKTPSVCNRQAWRLHVYQNPQKIQRILLKQHGNRGFNDSIGTLLVVSADLRCFFTIEERNQAFIDGGLYSMSLIYALHSLGLGTCCLNLALGMSGAKRFKKEASIPANEVLIMALAVGHYQKHFNVACSPRREAEADLQIH